MREYRIDHPHNEASALLGIANAALLEKRGWTDGWWIVSDELPAHEAVAALGRREDDQWEVVHLDTRPGEIWTSKRCEDCETMARAGSHVYVIGSQFGSKGGPLQPKRHFIGRFNEALIDFEQEPPVVPFDLARRPFLLHRLLNDALREAGLELLESGEALTSSMIEAALERGEQKQKSWKDLVKPGDLPINIEGGTFVEGGRLLLGLRYPVTKDGHPIVVELEGIDRYFDDDLPLPVVHGVRVLANVGERSRPAGIRELDSRRGQVHAITGDLDSSPDRSAVIADHPEGTGAANEHWVFDIAEEGPLVTATRIRGFGDDAQVEGIALEGDRVWYVHDDEQIRLESAELE